VAVTLASPAVRPAADCACVAAPANKPSNITLARTPAILVMAVTFRGVGLPDAGFLGVMVARGAAVVCAINCRDQAEIGVPPMRRSRLRNETASAT
jgi:hypothetical protein